MWKGEDAKCCSLYDGHKEPFDPWKALVWILVSVPLDISQENAIQSYFLMHNYSVPVFKGAVYFAVPVMLPKNETFLHFLIKSTTVFRHQTKHQSSFHRHILQHPVTIDYTSRQWTYFEHETEGSDYAPMLPTGGHCERHWGWTAEGGWKTPWQTHQMGSVEHVRWLWQLPALP